MTAQNCRGENQPGAEGEVLDGLRRRLEALERERNQFREAFEASEGNSRSAFHATPAGMSLSRVDSGKILDMNAAFLHILGFERDEVVGRTSSELNLWVSEDSRDSLVGELRAKEQVAAREVPMRRKDGKIVTVLFSAVPALVGGEPHTITWVLDVTARREAEEALHRSKDRLQLVFDSTSDLIILYDVGEDGTARVSSTNRAALEGARRRGYAVDADTFSGMDRHTFTRLFYGSDADAIRTSEELFAAALGGGESVTHELKITTPRGEVFLDGTLTPVRDAQGRVRHVLWSARDVTRRMAAEAALASSEARWRSVLTHAPAAISQVDRDGTVIYINRSLTGRPAEELIGRRIFDFIGEEAAAIGRVKLAEAFDTARMVRFDISMPTVDGGRVYAQNTLAPVVIEGTVQSVIAVVTDTTAQVEARRALAESEARFRDIVESMGDWLVELDASWRVTFSSPQVEQLLGYTPGEMLGKTPMETVAPEERERLTALMVDFLEKPRPIRDVEVWHLRKDGRRVCLSVSGVPLFDKDGAPRGMRSVAHDITERKRAEQAIAESERRFSDIAHSMADWIWECDAQLRLSYCSERVRDVLGYSSEEVLGRVIPEFIHPEDRAVAAGQITGALQAGRSVRDDTRRLVRKDGAVVYVTTSAVPVIGADGSPRGLRGVNRDITAQVRAAEERRRIETSLQQAQKLESLGILAGGIAHDFNNLLAAVLGNAELALAELPPAAAARESVEQIQKAALHAAELTHQMLAYAGRGRIAVQPVDVSAVVRDMSPLIGASVSKRHALRFDLAEGLPAVEADPTQVRQIVMNLMINASEASGEQQGVLAVRTSLLGPGEDVGADAAIGDAGPGRHVLLEVTDTGAGIDATTLGRIFDPFFTTKFAGRGLGLAAVLGIVRRHGGALRVRSRPGSGSAFSVLFPVKEGGGPAPTAGARAGGADAWRGAGTLLLVEDEEPVRDITSRMLHAMGFEVVAAGDGVEALERLTAEGNRIRAVLLDLTMPRMDGEEALRGIRAISPDLPVVLCSGYDVFENQGRFADLEFNGFLQKPFRLAELQRALRRVLGE